MSPLAFIARGTTHIPFPDLSAAMDQFLPFPASEDLLPSAVRTESPQRRCFFDPQVRVRGDFSDDRRKDAGGAVPDDRPSATSSDTDLILCPSSSAPEVGIKCRRSRSSLAAQLTYRFQICLPPWTNSCLSLHPKISSRQPSALNLHSAVVFLIRRFAFAATSATIVARMLAELCQMIRIRLPRDRARRVERDGVL